MATEVEKTEYYKSVRTKAEEAVGNSIDEDDILRCQIAIWSDDFKTENEDLAILYGVAEAAEKAVTTAGNMVKRHFQIAETLSPLEYNSIMEIIKEKKKTTPGGVFAGKVVALMNQYAESHKQWAVSCKALSTPLNNIKVISACLEKYKKKE